MKKRRISKYALLFSLLLTPIILLANQERDSNKYIWALKTLTEPEGVWERSVNDYTYKIIYDKVVKLLVFSETYKDWSITCYYSEVEDQFYLDLVRGSPKNARTGIKPISKPAGFTIIVSFLKTLHTKQLALPSDEC